jgi:hypothetical protein
VMLVSFMTSPDTVSVFILETSSSDILDIFWFKVEVVIIKFALTELE